MIEQKRYSLKIIGRVQGVFYRASSKNKALELGIEGWVSNHPDGSVRMEIQGEKETLSSFLEWAEEGPIHSRVDHIELEELPLSNLPEREFEIRRN